MNIKIQMIIVSLCSWAGMVLFLIIGGLIYMGSEPLPQLECPNYVWDTIETGSLTRAEITESQVAMNKYNCSWAEPEKRRFEATNYLLFGIVTGFAFGTWVMPEQKLLERKQ